MLEVVTVIKLFTFFEDLVLNVVTGGYTECR